MQSHGAKLTTAQNSQTLHRTDRHSVFTTDVEPHSFFFEILSFLSIFPIKFAHPIDIGVIPIYHLTIPGYIPETAVHYDDIRLWVLSQVSQYCLHIGGVAAGDEVEADQMVPIFTLELPHFLVPLFVHQL